MTDLDERNRSNIQRARQGLKGKPPPFKLRNFCHRISWDLQLPAKHVHLRAGSGNPGRSYSAFAYTASRMNSVPSATGAVQTKAPSTARTSTVPFPRSVANPGYRLVSAAAANSGRDHGR